MNYLIANLAWDCTEIWHERQQFSAEIEPLLKYCSIKSATPVEDSLALPKN